MKTSTYYLILIIIFSSAMGSIDEEDANLSVPELIEKYTYPLEIHYVTTNDGYILTIHRIPSNVSNARPVLMVHGLMGASSEFVLLGPKKALAYKTFDAGFDVWLLSCRGNSYSRNHTKLDPNLLEFWNFTFEEMGLYDAPAVIDYILKDTNQNQLDFIGYSQGNTVGFVLLSMLPEYNSKIRNLIAITPLAFMSKTHNLVLDILAPPVQAFEPLNAYVQNGEFKIHPIIVNLIIKGLCSETDLICKNLYLLLFGYGSGNMDPKMYHLLAKHYPSSCSTKQIIHYCQFVNTPYFRRFDYGTLENYRRYGSYNPKNYDLSKITAKIHLHYSDVDTIATLEDIEHLCSLLKNCNKQFYPGFNHLDTMFATTADQIYDNILNVLLE